MCWVDHLCLIKTCTYPQIKDQIVNDIKVSPIDKFHLKTYKYIADISLNIYFITCNYGTKGRKTYNNQSIHALNSYLRT